MAAGERRSARLAAAAAVAACAWLLATPASAQTLNPYGPRAERGFGHRDAFAFTLEQVFGFEHLELGSEDSNGNSHTQSYDTKPMGALYWGDVGLFSVSQNGLTLGTLLGFTHVFVPSGSDSAVGNGSEDATIIRLKPRIGYAGAATPSFGYWLRGGPSFFTAFSGSDNQVYSFAAGAEAYVVITPYPHFSVLLGPNFDINIFGRDHDGNPAKVTQYGMSVGLMGELW